MKQQINEVKRMQQLAGLIKESQLNEIENYFFPTSSDNDKALGILFQPNDDEEEVEETPYMWDEDNIFNLVKDMGYEDYQDVAGETIHYTSPGDIDEMTMFRNLTGNPNLQPEDITIGMFKQSIEYHFPEKSI
jgi:hypothetical protein